MANTVTTQNRLGGFSMLSLAALIIVYSYAALPFNLAPLLIGTIVLDFNVSEASAGLLISAELVAIALTTMTLAARVEKLPVRKLAVLATITLSTLNLFSALPEDLSSLCVMRTAAGVSAGVMITCVYYLVGISTAPVRLFGVLTVGGVLTGAVFLTLLPVAIEAWHYRGAFTVMATPFVIAVFFLVNIRQPEASDVQPISSAKGSLGWQGLLFVIAIFIVQAAQGGYYAFVELIGIQLAVAPETIGMTLAASYFLSLGGSSVAGILGDRFGVQKPLLIGMSGHALAVCFVVFAGSQSSYLIPLFPQAFFFFLFLPYMLGLAATLDHSGHLSTLAGGVIMLGLGVGPFISGNLVEAWGYSTIAYSVVCSVVIGYLIMLYASRKILVRTQTGSWDTLIQVET